MSVVTALPVERETRSLTDIKAQMADVYADRFLARKAAEQLYTLIGKARRAAGPYVRSLVQRVPSWARTFLRNTVHALPKSRLPLALWAVTSPLVQRAAKALFGWLGRAARGAVLAVSDLAQWVLFRCGGWGRRMTLRVGFGVEWLDKQTTRAGQAIGRVLDHATADKPHVQALHDLSTVVLAAQTARQLVPVPWRLLVWPLSLVLFGGRAKGWLASIAALGAARLFQTSQHGTLVPDPVTITNGASPSSSTTVKPPSRHRQPHKSKR